MTTEREDRAEEQAKAQYDSIRELVGALECDYDRLEELRDARAALEAADDEALAELQAEWDGNNGEELNQLAVAAGDCQSEDEARQRIQEDVLSVEVRSSWTTPGEPMQAEEYCILLCTGGPAARIVSNLDRGEPTSARLECQDWPPWTEYLRADRELFRILREDI